MCFCDVLYVLLRLVLYALVMKDLLFRVGK
jgi:hypothetical protein